MKNLGMVGVRIGLAIGWLGLSTIALAQSPVTVRAHNTDILLSDTVAAHLMDLSARLVPRGTGAVDLEDADSFTIRVDAGCARLSGEQLTRLFNDRILARGPQSLHAVRFEPGDETLKVRGGVRLWHRIPPFWLSFTARATAGVDADGLIHVRVHDEHIVGLPVAGLLDLVHTPLAALVSLDGPGTRLAGDDVIIDTRSVLPGPAIETRPTSAQFTPDGLVVCFGDAPMAAPPAAIARHPAYLWVTGKELRALGQRIAPARLAVIPARDQTGPLRFRLVKSRAQIAAGRIELEANGRMIIRPGPANPP